MMTGLVRDLKLLHGDKYLVDIRTKFSDLWRFNPYLTPLDKADMPRVELISLGGDGPNAADRQSIGMSKKSANGGEKAHYCTAFHRAFQKLTGIRVTPQFSKPDIHLSAEERREPIIQGRYWIVIPGGKTDITVKWWSTARFQEVVNQLRSKGLQIVQEGADKPRHFHPPLDGVLNLNGQTSIRDLIRNIYHAEGVICGCSLPMHIAGALEKPCVVLFGGREEPWYEEYSNQWNAFGPDAAPVRVPHKLLHTIGQLSCCKHGGCWLQRVERLNDGRQRAERSICVMPDRSDPNQTLPKCMSMITVDQVIAAVMGYYADGTLAPITTSEKIVTAKDLFGPPPEMPPLPELLRKTELQQTLWKQANGISNVNPTVQLERQPIGEDRTMFNHTAIGGELPIFLLLHGKDAAKHRRCLKSLTEAGLVEGTPLRVICNGTGPLTRQALIDYQITPEIAVEHPLPKYEIMRQAFKNLAAEKWQWLVWLDDTAYVQNSSWLVSLAQVIIDQSSNPAVGAIGSKYCHVLKGARNIDPRSWFRRGKWFKGRKFLDRNGHEAPNGDCVHYIAPNFMVLRRKAIIQCGIPDERINQFGGGIAIGEQLHQHGFLIKAFNSDNRHVGIDRDQEDNSPRYPWAIKTAGS